MSMNTLEEAVLAYPDVDSIENASLFLSRICPATFFDSRILPVAFPSPDAFAAVLYKGPQLHDLAKASHAKRNFQSFWPAFKDVLLTFIAFPFPSPNGIAEALSALEEVRGELSDAAQGRRHFEPWTFSDEADLSRDTDFLNAFDLIKTHNSPSMELLGLGQFGDVPDLHKRVSELFTPGLDTFLMNSSGTGKTKLLLEGLCQNWGLYVTAARDSSRIGSVVMQRNLGGGTRPLRAIVPHSPPSGSLGSNILQTHNASVIRRICNSILLAYIMVFHAYLKDIHELEGVAAPNVKREWLKYHSIPSTPISQDPIERVHRLLADAPEDDITRLIETQWSEVRRYCNGPMFIVLDEANALARMFSNAFTDSEGNYISLLTMIVASWKAALGDFATIVVAGTDIPKEHFKAPQWLHCRWSSDTGSFHSRDLHERYLQQVIPPSLLSSSSGQILRDRMWQWCRYRHRFTAGFVALLVSNSYKHPNRSFRALLNELVGYRIREEEVDRAEGDEDQDFEGRYESFSRVLELTGNSALLRSSIHQSVFHCLITSHRIVFLERDRIDLVKHGVARFIDAHMSQIAIDDPMLLCTAAIWLHPPSIRHRVPFSSMLGGREEYEIISVPARVTSQNFADLFQFTSERPHNPACFLAWYFAHAFLSKKPLTHFFSFANLQPLPPWATRGAQLVLLRRSPMGHIHHIPVTKSDVHPESPPLGYQAESKAEVASFLQIEKDAVFCVCPGSCSADLIFALKLSNQNFVWVFLRCRDGGSDGPLRGNLDAVVESLLPENLFVDEAESLTHQSIEECLSVLPSPLPRHPVLRVVATFPDAPDLKPYSGQRLSKSPLAGLRLDLSFKPIINNLPSEEIIEGVVASATNKRRPALPLTNEPTVTRAAKKSRKQEPQIMSRELRPRKSELSRLRPRPWR